MPLVTCPDCRREISDAAPACIHCGRPVAGVRKPAATVSGRRHPLGASSAAPATSMRAMGRFAAAMVVIVVTLARWRYGGRSEGLDLVLAGVMPLALGVYLLLREVPETPGVAGTGRRGGLNVWTAEQEARRGLGWSTILGGVLVVIGILTLLVAIFTT